LLLRTGGGQKQAERGGSGEKITVHGNGSCLSPKLYVTQKVFLPSEFVHHFLTIA